MQGGKLSQAQKAFDEMNEESVEKKVSSWLASILLCFV